MKKITLAMVSVLVSGAVMSTSVFASKTEFTELQTWHTSGVVTSVIAPSTPEVVVPPVVETTPEYVAPSTPEVVVPPVVETTPEYVAPSTSEVVVPPVVETTPEYVAPSAPVDPSVNEGSGWIPPTAEELDDYISGVDWDNPLWCYDFETGNDYYCVYE
ncbi:MAG: hypothetical protein ACRDCC_08225 [Culicoidibacterales bacterium]